MEVDHADFVAKFTDPNTKDLAIAIALRDLKLMLASHVDKQDELINSIVSRIQKLEEHHEKDIEDVRDMLKDTSARITSIEITHEREAAVHEKDEARLLWLNRLLSGGIGSMLLAAGYWLKDILDRAGR